MQVHSSNCKKKNPKTQQPDRKILGEGGGILKRANSVKLSSPFQLWYVVSGIPSIRTHQCTARWTCVGLFTSVEWCKASCNVSPKYISMITFVSIWNFGSWTHLNTQIYALYPHSITGRVKFSTKHKSDWKLLYILQMSTCLWSGWVSICQSMWICHSVQSQHVNLSSSQQKLCLFFPFFMSERHWQNLQLQSSTYPVRQVALIKYWTSQLPI